MTSEPDSTSRRRPPTIELTAKEVEADQPDSTRNSAAQDAGSAQAAAAQAQGARSGRVSFGRVMPYAIGAAAGAIAVAAIVAGFWFAGFVPAREPAATPPGLQEAKSTSNDEVSSRLDKIEQALKAPRTASDEAFANRLATAEAQTKALSDSVAALTRRVDEIAAASQNALAQAKAATTAAEAAKNAATEAGAQRADMGALDKRISALESAVKSLSAAAQRPSSADDRVARTAVAAEALRAAVERGAPFAAELNAAKSLGADQAAVAALAPFAEGGLPTGAALGRELSALVPALQKATAPATNDGSFLGRIEAHAKNLVSIEPIDASSGVPADSSSSIARIAAAAARGDIAGALEELGSSPDQARAPAEGWIKKAKACEAAVAASRRIAADALAALAKPAPQ